MTQHAPRKPPQAQTPEKHPDEYLEDLNPSALAGQNIGVVGAHPEKDLGRTAYDIKDAHVLLQGFSSDELREMRILPAGTRLENKATYIDLRHLERGEFTATGDWEVSDDQWIVPKKSVDYELWNRLRGIHDVRRTGTEG